MQRITTLFLACGMMLLSTVAVQAQYYYYDSRYYDTDLIWEFGGSWGLMNGITDVGSKKGIMPSFKQTQMNAGVFVGAMYKNVAGVRLELTYGRIAGADSLGANKNRNLSFRTPINEIAVIGEFHPLNLRYRDEPLPISPYVAAGFGFFTFNPQANLNGRWVDLQPLRTEGQGFPESAQFKQDHVPYKLYSSAILMGFGVKYELSHLFTLRGEFMYRKTFTDYLDDASTFYVDPAWFDANLSPANAALARQLYDRTSEKFDVNENGVGSFIRGNQKTKDAFYSFNLKLSINLGRQRRAY